LSWRWFAGSFNHLPLDSSCGFLCMIYSILNSCCPPPRAVGRRVPPLASAGFGTSLSCPNPVSCPSGDDVPPRPSCCHFKSLTSSLSRIGLHISVFGSHLSFCKICVCVPLGLAVSQCPLSSLMKGLLSSRVTSSRSDLRASAPSFYRTQWAQLQAF